MVVFWSRIRARTPLLVLVTAALAGCAVMGRGPKGATPDSELARGVAALVAQDYASARAILEPLYRAHYMDKTGQRALMLLTTSELDPRNAGRRLAVGSEYARMMLTKGDSTDTWQRPLAETLYLLSQELGGHEDELASAEAARQRAQQNAAALQRKLPQSTRESWPAQVKKIKDDRDALSKRVEQLQATIRAKDRDLAEATQELERIKKTLKIK